MSAISGTRRAMKEMADGTIRVSIDIDPIHRAAFFEMFGQIDMPVALAPLVADFEQTQPTKDKPKGGALAKLSGQWCNDPNFWDWLNASRVSSFSIDDAQFAAHVVRDLCEVESRADLDNIPSAAELFHRIIREPYSAWLKKQGLA